MIKKISSLYVNIEEFITNLLMIGVVFFVFIAALMRWAGSPISWSVEFATLLFVWVIFLGANRALREGRHIGVDFFTNKLPEKIRISIEILVLLLMSAFLLFLIYFGWELSVQNSSRTIGNLGISNFYVTVSIPVASFLMVISIIFKLKDKVISLGSES
ncbi:TRAP transporter small permease [Halobacillus sp. B23F22_1]|uniref:TRAP transporter small permease n=1 Tax=Halobacillus sp. B23F22_1 TaxID=3459514 RepID=UPI00373EB852